MENKSLMIKNLNRETIKQLMKNDQLFGKFLKINKGFVDETVLSVIKRDKLNQNYDDYFQVACLGLYKALEKFNPDKATFSTFAFKVMQNEVRQEIKKLNKQKHIVVQKNQDGTTTYSHKEIPMEYLKFRDDSLFGNNGHTRYKEHLFKETPKIKTLRNFEDTMLNSILLDERFTKLSELEKDIYQWYYHDNVPVKEIAQRLGQNYSTFKKKFYRHIKSKFDKMHEELR